MSKKINQSECDVDIEIWKAVCLNHRLLAKDSQSSPQIVYQRHETVLKSENAGDVYHLIWRLYKLKMIVDSVIHNNACFALKTELKTELKTPVEK